MVFTFAFISESMLEAGVRGTGAVVLSHSQVITEILVPVFVDFSCSCSTFAIASGS